MPWYFLCLEPGSDTYLFQETLYRSESCRRRLRKTAPYGPPGMATQVRPAYRRHYLYFSIACRSIWQLSSAPSPPVLSECLDRSCILELRSNQCFVCNFLSVPRCQCQVALKKTHCHSCFTWNFRNMLTPV